MKKLSIYFFILTIIAACTTSTTSGDTSTADTLTVASEYIEYNNPPAEGFNQEGSDLLATLLADKVMLAMGGREAWDKTRYLSWNFFGRRDHVWDKWTGDVRIEEPANKLIVLMNINTKEGQVQKNGALMTDSADYFLQKGYEWWINDAYWLVMPFKLKDSGVTLKYLREDTTQSGTRADVISMSFQEVGVTPENIYEVWIDTDSKLITQWAYYPDSSSLEPRFITPWKDYSEYNGVLLSGNRGDYALTNIVVVEEDSIGLLSSFDASISSLR